MVSLIPMLHNDIRDCGKAFTLKAAGKQLGADSESITSKAENLQTSVLLWSLRLFCSKRKSFYNIINLKDLSPNTLRGNGSIYNYERNGFHLPPAQCLPVPTLRSHWAARPDPWPVWVRHGEISSPPSPKATGTSPQPRSPSLSPPTVMPKEANIKNSVTKSETPQTACLPPTTTLLS